MDDPARKPFLYSLLLALGYVPFLFNGWLNAQIYTVPLWYWSLELLSWAVLPVLVFTLASKKGGLRREEVGISLKMGGSRNVPRLVMVTLLFAGFGYILYILVFAFAVNLVPDRGLFNYTQVLPPAGATRTLVALYFAFSAGIVEELYYRGLLFRICQYWSRPALPYLLLSPALFTLAHWENGVDDMLIAWIMGVVYALLFLRWRNLLPLIAAHALTDYAGFS